MIGKYQSRNRGDNVSVGFVIHKSERKQLKEIAAKEGITLSHLIARTMREVHGIKSDESKQIKYF